MHIIEVTPASKSVRHDSLHYYCRQSFEVGQIVLVPIRKQVIPALVVNVTGVRNSKLDLKSADFTLRKVETLESAGHLEPSAITAITHFARRLPIARGILLERLLPKYRQLDELTSERNLSTDSSTTPLTLGLFAPQQERLSFYKQLLDRLARHGRGLHVVLPTVTLAKHWAKLLHDCAEDIILLHSAQSASTRARATTRIDEQNGQGNFIIVSTPRETYFDCHDTAALVIESDSPQYRARQSPQLDQRQYLQELAHTRGQAIIYAGAIPDLARYQQLQGNTCITINDLPQSLVGKTRLIAYPDKDSMSVQAWTARESDLLGAELLFHLDEAIGENKRVVVFSYRTGLASSIVCRDCGQLLRDLGSNHVFTLREHQGKRALVAPGVRVKAPDLCPYCHGFGLTPLGITIGSLAEELARLRPDWPLLVCDDTIKSDTAHAKLAEHFRDSSPGILIASNRLLPYLDDSADLVVVPSLDQLAAQSRHDTVEWVSRILSNLGQVSPKVLVQSRHHYPHLEELIRDNSWQAAYDQDLELRIKLQYPPHSTHIHIRARNHKHNLTQIAGTLKQIIPDGGTLIEQPNRLILRLSADSWPHPPLVGFLQQLFGPYEIIMNPVVI